MTHTTAGGAKLEWLNRLAMVVCLALVQLCGPGAQRCRADMNPPKPIISKPYVPKTPKIIRLARPAASHGGTNTSGAPRAASGGGKQMTIGARKAWQKRVSNRFSQASQAGTVSTLLAHK